jgi:hypothetical protein
MNPEIIRYSERPELWDSIGDLSTEVGDASGLTMDRRLGSLAW